MRDASSLSGLSRRQREKYIKSCERERERERGVWHEGERDAGEEKRRRGMLARRQSSGRTGMGGKRERERSDFA